MKKVIVVLVVLAVGVIAFGFFRGWFALSNPDAVAGSHDVNVNLATDTEKMQADVKIVKDKAEQLAGQATSGSSESDQQSPDDDDAESPASRTEPQAEADPTPDSPNVEE